MAKWAVVFDDDVRIELEASDRGEALDKAGLEWFLYHDGIGTIASRWSEYYEYSERGYETALEHDCIMFYDAWELKPKAC